jgi:hypothetical protein
LFFVPVFGAAVLITSDSLPTIISKDDKEMGSKVSFNVSELMAKAFA